MNDYWESFRLANSYSNTYAMGAIFATALATFLPRFFPTALLKNRTLPSWFTQWLHFVPPAIFGALVFPDLLLKDGTLCLSLDNIPLLTTLLIAPIVIRTKSLGAAIICGGTVFYILQEWL